MATTDPICFMAYLRRCLADRARVHGHAFVTYEEARYMLRHDLRQPGHTRERFSTAAEDRSDAALARRRQSPDGSRRSTGA